MGKKKDSIYINFLFERNKEVQLDLQHFEIFIFSSLAELAACEKVDVPTFAIWNMRDTLFINP